MADTKVAGATIVLDLGKQSRKQVKRLRRGGGKLTAKIDATIEQLRADGELASGGDVVVVVVKQKPASKFKLFG